MIFKLKPEECDETTQKLRNGDVEGYACIKATQRHLGESEEATVART